MEQKILDIIRADIEKDGYEIVELKCGPCRNRIILRLFIHKPGGITVDDCTRVSRTIKFLLASDEAGVGDYELEVSSPGLDRPLTTDKDFIRNIGRDVIINLLHQVSGKVYYEGKVVSAAGGNVTIDSCGLVTEIPVSAIANAKLKIIF
jgi:ribosome maturation factor RimP